MSKGDEAVFHLGAAQVTRHGWIHEIFTPFDQPAMGGMQGDL